MSTLMVTLDLALGHSWIVLLVLGLLALAAYPFYPAQQSYLAHKTSEHLSTFLAWNSSGLYLGITLGSAIFGFIINRWTFEALPLTASGIGLLSLIASLLRLSRRRILLVQLCNRGD